MCGVTVVQTPATRHGRGGGEVLNPMRIGWCSTTEVVLSIWGRALQLYIRHTAMGSCICPPPFCDMQHLHLHAKLFRDHPLGGSGTNGRRCKCLRTPLNRECRLHLAYTGSTVSVVQVSEALVIGSDKTHHCDGVSGGCVISWECDACSGL